MSVTSEEDSAAREVTGSYFTDPQAGEVSFTKMDPFSALTGSLFGKPRGLTSKKGQTTQTVQSTAEGVIVVTRSFSFIKPKISASYQLNVFIHQTF